MGKFRLSKKVDDSALSRLTFLLRYKFICCESMIIKGSVEITPLMCIFLTCFLTWLRFSRFKKYLLFFLPCSCHRALARNIIPSTLSSYSASKSCLHFLVPDAYYHKDLFEALVLPPDNVYLILPLVSVK